MKQYHQTVKGKVRRGTGAKKLKSRDKKLAHVGGVFLNTKIGQRSIKITRKRGGATKIKLRKDLFANVASKEGVKKAKILRVIESITPDYTRQGIITKNTVIETQIGKAVVTSRPGQDGLINAKLLA
ncbi:MAG: 30S ribosomal protein S8e [Methanobacteriota archaeon]|nr:MAG: 30S ribosomal protein S8e [Euryarchaeota archaeon]